jgi:hypothetical protein
MFMNTDTVKCDYSQHCGQGRVQSYSGYDVGYIQHQIELEISGKTFCLSAKEKLCPVMWGCRHKYICTYVNTYIHTRISSQRDEELRRKNCAM